MLMCLIRKLLLYSSFGAFFRNVLDVLFSELEAQAEFLAALGESKSCFVFIAEMIVCVYEMIRDFVPEPVGNYV